MVRLMECTTSASQSSMIVCGLMSTALFGSVGFQLALVFADGCPQAKPGTANGLVALGVHLDRFFSPASAGLFLLPEIIPRQSQDAVAYLLKIAILSVMVARFDFYFDKMGKMTK